MIDKHGRAYVNSQWGAPQMMTTPHHLISLKTVKTSSISFSDLTFSICTTNGSVYTWGEHKEGALGQDPPDSKIPTKLKSLERREIKAKTTCAANSQLFILSTDGKLYVSGSKNEGQLGLGTNSKEIIIDPVVIPLREKITQVDAGNERTNEKIV